jgi:hypothetical protein
MRRYYFTRVTSTRHVVNTSQAKLEDDGQAEDFARKTLDAANTSIVVVEAWERSRLVCRVPRGPK